MTVQGDLPWLSSGPVAHSWGPRLHFEGISRWSVSVCPEAYSSAFRAVLSTWEGLLGPRGVTLQGLFLWSAQQVSNMEPGRPTLGAPSEMQVFIWLLLNVSSLRKVNKPRWWQKAVTTSLGGSGDFPDCSHWGCLVVGPWEMLKKGRLEALVLGGPFL